MALKPTIYKFNIVLSDLNRNHYDNLNLTLAQHPSETSERMLARVIAFCINAQPFLSFTKGLSDTEQPDIWSRTLDEQISVWIELGEPEVERIKKASHKAQSVKVYSFNTKSDVWWEQSRSKFIQLSAEFYRFNWNEIKILAKKLQRSMSISVMITGHSAYISTDLGECEVTWMRLE